MIDSSKDEILANLLKDLSLGQELYDPYGIDAFKEFIKKYPQVFNVLEKIIYDILSSPNNNPDYKKRTLLLGMLIVNACSLTNSEGDDDGFETLQAEQLDGR